MLFVCALVSFANFCGYGFYAVDIETSKLNTQHKVAHTVRLNSTENYDSD